MRFRRNRVCGACGLALLLLLPFLASAQRSVSVRVRVVDSAGALVPGADVAIVSGVNAILASATSDVTNSRALRFTTKESSYQIVVRKLGYARASRFVSVTSSDTALVDIVLVKSAAQLAAVNVTGEVSKKRQRTFVDADAIAATNRTLYDAIDVIEKLRPGMTLEPPDITGTCVSAKNLWVNGLRVAVSDVAPQKPRVAGQRPAVPTARVGHALASASDDMVYLLSRIKPEHIASIDYHDCTDMSVGKIGSESALFIILKDGIGYQNGRGSYVLPPVERNSALAMPRPAANVVTRSLDLDGRAAPLPAYRSRILGVYDADSGDALEGVDVRDVKSGTGMLTSTTGTVSLVFLPDAGGRVVLTKPGFRPDTMIVRISPADTIPVTAVLSRIK